jgi:hypothetical protein
MTCRSSSAKPKQFELPSYSTSSNPQGSSRFFVKVSGDKSVVAPCCGEKIDDNDVRRQESAVGFQAPRSVWL